MVGRSVLLLLLAGVGASHAQAKVPICGYRVVETLPHDPTMFTEGFFYRDGMFFESAGMPGASRIIARVPTSATPLRAVRIDPRLFGEGIIDWGDQLISLTWRDGVGLRWRRDTFELLGSFPLDGEGWGMTRDDESIYQSDGSSTLIVRDPESFAVRRRLPVTADGVPIERLNELEWIDGEIWANVWMTDRVARIDPATGHVRGWIDLDGLRARANAHQFDDVLNGIAYDSRAKRIFVTGKHWDKIFRIAVACPSPPGGTRKPAKARR
jgi:glutamine cyclotransferase